MGLRLMAGTDTPVSDFSSHSIFLWGLHMATKKRAVRSRRQASGALAVLRRRAQAMMGRLRRVGMQQVRAIERQIDKLNHQRQALLSELGSGLGSGGSGNRRGGGGSAGRGGRARVDWDQIFAKLPKTSFRASDVRAIPSAAKTDSHLPAPAASVLRNTADGGVPARPQAAKR